MVVAFPFTVIVEVHDTNQTIVQSSGCIRDDLGNSVGIERKIGPDLLCTLAQIRPTAQQCIIENEVQPVEAHADKNGRSLEF
jgi:hypothetical protein